MPTNDNDSALRGPPSLSDEAHGYAALLLVESLIHGLRENATLSAQEAVDIVERAASVQHDQAEEADGAGAPMWRSHLLLTAIAKSLRTEDGGDAGAPRPAS